MARQTLRGAKRAEMGRRVALKEITTHQAMKEYGCKDNVVWKARREYLEANGPREPELPMSTSVNVAVNVKPAQDMVDQLRLLRTENEALHDEVRTLQKLLMTVGRAL